MKEVFVEAIGIAAPGLPNWQMAAPILRGERDYVLEPLSPHTPALLPPNERRRATPTVRLAFQAAEDVVRDSSIAAADLATVFASSDADLGVIHRICSALAVTPRMISPTDFHNSVHNAAAGYWSIAVGAKGPSTAISAYDYSFTAGLAEAYSLALIDDCDVLLAAYDLPPPEPLYAKRPIANPVAIALILSRRKTSRSLASLRCEHTLDRITSSSHPQLEALRLSNPAARGLPLVEHIARKQSARVVLPASPDAAFAVEVSVA